MKKFTFLLKCFLSFLSISCFNKITAQSNSADSKDPQLIEKKTYSNEEITQLKATQTVFFYKKENMADTASFQQAVREGWDLTPIIFDSIQNYSKYAGNSQYSYFIIEKFHRTYNNWETYNSITHRWDHSTPVEVGHVYLALCAFPEKDKKGNVASKGIYRIELYPNTNTLKLLIADLKEPRNTYSGKALYDYGVFYNWDPVILKAQLQSAENNLKTHARPGLFENMTPNNLSSSLSNDVLYVPKKLLVNFNALNGKEKPMEENVMEGYKFPYKICSDEELWDVFENQKKGRYLLEYVKSSSDKFLTIYDLKDKKIIYKKYTPVSYNLKKKDLEQIK